MTLIITGAEGGLGKRLKDLAGAWGYDDILTIDREYLGSKKGIDEWWDWAWHSSKISDPCTIINNFGINHLSWIGTTEECDEALIQFNLMAPYFVVNAAVGYGFTGKILNVASATHRIAQRTTTLYCASKAGLVHMTRVMARELAPGWQVNSVSPGLMPETSMAKKTRAQVREIRDWTEEEEESYMMSMIPMGRPTSTDEVSEAIFRMLEMPAYVTGANLEVMGGA